MDVSASQKVFNFFKGYKSHLYKKSDIFIQPHTSPAGIFFIESGKVKKYTVSQKGNELTLNLYQEGSFFPMSWVINNTENEYYFEAVTDSLLWCAPREAVLSFVKQEPDVLYDLLSRVYKGADGMTTRMIYHMAGNAYVRLVSEIVIQAKRFGRINTQGAIELATSETELASQAGIARETVSREMKTLKEKGLVTFTKNIICLKQLDKLEEELLIGM